MTTPGQQMQFVDIETGRRWKGIIESKEYDDETNSDYYVVVTEPRTEGDTGQDIWFVEGTTENGEWIGYWSGGGYDE